MYAFFRNSSFIGAEGFEPAERRKAFRFYNGPLAQLGEQQTLNLRVEGSIPSRLTITARVVKLADTLDLGSSAIRRKGSSPFSRIKERKEKDVSLLLARVAQW